MRCPACEQQNRAGAGFCAWCGARLKPEQPIDEVPLPGREALARGPEAQVLSPPPPAVLASAPQPSVDHAPATDEPVASPPQESETTGKKTQPLSPGDILAGRYEIVERIETTPKGNRYRAIDLRRCVACGKDQDAPHAEYCSECGAALDALCYVTIVEHVRCVPDVYDLHFRAEDREYFVTIESELEGEDQDIPTGSPPLRLLWGHATHPGLQRDHNEDHLDGWLYRRGSGGLLGLFVVADGLGGQDSGEVASQMATEVVWQSLRESVWEPLQRGEAMEPDALEAHLIAAVEAANQAVYECRTARNSEMSTTLTLALAVGSAAYIGNVGDSRAYLWSRQGLRQVTKDHSLVQRLVDAGEIAPEDIYTHPQRNLIYQSIGDRPSVQVDAFRRQLSPDDRLILCSDGLWETVRDEGLEEVLLAETDPQRACEQLVRNANLAGGEDNISVIIVRAVKPGTQARQ